MATGYRWHPTADPTRSDHPPHSPPGRTYPLITVRSAARSRMPLERLTACRFLTRGVEFTAGCSATITAQRQAGTDITTWTVRLDPG